MSLSTSDRTGRAGRTVVALVLLLTPGLALACPGCLGQDSEKLFHTYLWSTIVLSLLPFAIVTVIALVAMYFRRLAAVDADIALSEPEPSPHPA